MVFPVAMYGCKSWTIKKAACQRSDAFKLWCWKRLKSPLDCREIKPVNPKRNQPWIFTGRTDAKAEGPTLWPLDAKSQLFGKDLDAVKVWGQEKGVAEDEVVGWYHWLNGHEFEQTLGNSGGWGAWCAAVHGVAKSWTQLSNWTTTSVFDETTHRNEQAMWKGWGCFYRNTLLDPSPDSLHRWGGKTGGWKHSKTKESSHWVPECTHLLKHAKWVDEDGWLYCTFP